MKYETKKYFRYDENLDSTGTELVIIVSDEYEVVVVSNNSGNPFKREIPRTWGDGIKLYRIEVTYS